MRAGARGGARAGKLRCVRIPPAAPWRLHAWLWIGSNPHPVEAVREVAQKSAGVGRWTVTVAAVHARVEAARGQLASGSDATRQRGWWRVQGARQLEAQGRLEEAVSVAEGK